ncbi:hypothetical protein LTR95_012140 [Oleoguttula sp. CCFEE 5521]
MVNYKLILSAVAALATSAVRGSPVAPIPPLAPYPPVPLSPSDSAKNGHVAPPSYTTAKTWMDQHKMDSMLTYCDSDFRSHRGQTRFEIWGYVDSSNINFRDDLEAALTDCRHPDKYLLGVVPTGGQYLPFYAKWYHDSLGDKCTTHALADFVGTWPGVECT